MCLDLSQSQPGDLSSQRFDAPVLAYPLFDFREQIQRDVNGACFASLFAGEVIAPMASACLTVTAWPAAVLVDGDEAGGQEGNTGPELLEPSLELAADESGLFRDSHGVQSREAPALG